MTAKKLIAVALACVLTSCSDAGTGPSGPPAGDAGRFTGDRATYTQYEMAVLALNGAIPYGDISGMFGAEAVTLTPLGDSSVVFIVPAVTGAQTLTFTAGGREYEGTISVTARQSVADPVAYLTEFSDEFDGMMDDMEAELATDTLDNPVAQELVLAARDSLASFRSQIAQLTAAEAQQVADILSANLERVSTPGDQSALMAGVVHATANGAIPVKCRNFAKPLAKYTCTWLELVDRSARATLAISGSLLVAKASWLAPVVTGPVAAALGAFGLYEAVVSVKIALELVVIHGLFAWETGVAVYEAGSEYFQTRIVDRFLSEPGAIGSGFAAMSGASPASAFRLASSSMPPTTMSTLTNGRAMTFTFSPRFRNVQATDGSMPLPWLKLGLNALAGYNRLVSRINTDWQIEFAPVETVYAEPVHADEITIEIVGESTVRVDSISQDGDRITVKFASDETGVQDFQYDVIYDSGVYPEVRVRHDAELHPPGYIIADREFNEIGDTVTVVAGFEFHHYPLLDNDGSLIPDAERPLLQNPAGPWLTGVQVGTGAFVHEEQLYSTVTFNAFNYDPDVYSDTVDVDITVDIGNGNYRPMRTLTFIVDDSTKMYYRAAAGRWRQSNYSDGYLQSVTTFVLNEDGTGEILSHVFNGESVAVPDRAIDWNLTMGFAVGDNDIPYPTWHIYWQGDVDGGGGPVTYPVQSFSREMMMYSSVATKQ